MGRTWGSRVRRELMYRATRRSAHEYSSLLSLEDTLLVGASGSCSRPGRLIFDRPMC